MAQYVDVVFPPTNCITPNNRPKFPTPHLMSLNIIQAQTFMSFQLLICIFVLWGCVIFTNSGKLVNSLTRNLRNDEDEQNNEK